MSDLRATNFKGRTSGSVPNMPDGVVVGSAVTISSSGIDVGAAGIITATTFSGTVSSSTGSFSGDVDIADKIVHTGDTNTAIRFPAADTFTVETAGSERIRVDSSGLFGVGTNNPQLKFVVSNNNALGFEVDPSQSSGTICGVNAYDRNASAFKPLRLNAEDHRFDTSSTERLRITSAGQVLVNTSSSKAAGGVTADLQIEGTSTGSLRITRNASDAAPPHLVFSKSGGTSIGSNTTVDDDDNLGRIRFAGADGTDHASIGAEISAAVDGTPGSNDMPSRLVFATTADGAASPTERLRITSSGQVSISSDGTTDGLLTIKGDSDATGTPSIRLLDGSDTREVSVSNESGDFIISTHGTDNNAHGQIKIFESGIITLINGGSGGSLTERLRLDASGRLLLGTASDFNGGILCVGSGQGTNSPSGEHIKIGPNADRIEFLDTSSNTSDTGSISLYNTVYNNRSADIELFHPASNTGGIKFSTHDGTSLSERMRINNSGDITVAKTTTSIGTDGIVLGSGGLLTVARSNSYTSIFNRRADDGLVLVIAQGDTHEGGLQVSGSTVSVQGAHLTRWSQLAGNAERIEILRGSVLSNLDEMCEWAHAAQDAVLYTEEDDLPEGVSVGDVKTPAVEAYTEDNEQLNRMKVSEVEGDVNVAGVFQDWDNDDKTFTNDFNCAMTGDFVIRIAQGTTVARGDLLMSAGDGTAKPQGDDIVRSKTIAKVTSTTKSVTYSDGSYCVPCVLMAC